MMKTIYIAFFCSFCFLQHIQGQVQEGFEDGIPQNWTTYETEPDDYGFTWTSGGTHGGNKCLMHNKLDIATESTSYLVTESYTITDQTTDILSFWYSQSWTPDDYDYSGVWISTGSGNPIANPNDFTEIQEFNADFGYSENVWSEAVFDLSAYEGQSVYIAFKYTGDYSHVLLLDDFSLANGCTPPTGLGAVNITTTTVDLQWIESGTASEWIIEYGFEGFSPGGGTVYDDSDGIAGESLTGLLQNTNYEFYVSAVCAPGINSFAGGPYEFRTKCDQVFVAPWIDDVEDHEIVSNISESNCWTATKTISGSGWYYWNVGTAPTSPIETGPGAAHSGSKIFYIEDASLADAQATLYSPQIDISQLNNPALQFYCFLYGEDIGELHVDIFDGSIWHNDVSEFIGEQQSSYSDPWHREIINLSAFTGVIQVRFRNIWDGWPRGDVALDDISIAEAPPCADPTNLSANVVGTTADLAWTENGTATQWKIEYGPEGFAIGNGSVIIDSDNVPSITLSNLSEDTTYDVYVNAICQAGFESSLSSTSFSVPTICQAPIDLDAVVDENTVELHWVESSTATAWEVQYNLAGFDVGTGTGISDTDGQPGVQITGLENDTKYEFYVRAICDSSAQSPWSGPFFFESGCGTIFAPWLDNVENHTPVLGLSESNCWTAISYDNMSTGWYTWNVANGPVFPSSTGPSSAHSGTKYFYVEDAVLGQAETYLYTPEINIDALDVPALQFYYHMFGEDMGDLHIDVLQDNNWVEDELIIAGQQQTAETDPWLKAIVNLSDYSGIIRVRFRAIWNGWSAGDMAIDDISIDEGPSCFMPSNLIATDITDVSADLSWTENYLATKWKIEYGVTGFSPGSGIVVYDDDSIPAETITGLAESTAYDVYINAVCGSANESTIYGPFTFTTLPSCLSPSDLSVSDITDISASLSWTENDNATQWIVEYGTSGFSIGTGTIVNDADGIPSETIGGLTQTTDYEFYVTSVCAIDDESFPSGPYPFATIVPCMPPSDLSVEDITDTSAVLTWIENDDALVWKIEYGMSGFTPGNGIVINDTDGVSSTLVSGLTESTEYEFYVTSTCSQGEVSTVVGPYSFSTIASCLAPSDISATRITEHSIELSWNENGTATEWEIEYGPAGFAPGAGTYFFDNDGVPNEILENFPNQINYEFYITAICSATDESTSTGPFSFSLEPLGAACGGVFYDSGGPDEDYSFYEYSNTTFYPDEPGDVVTLNFVMVDIAVTDHLKIFNGDNSYSTPLLVDDLHSPVTVTSTSPTGALTVMFDSDGYYEGAGWKAYVLCGPSGACVKPQDISINEVSGSSFSLSWTELGTASQWEIEYGPTGFTPGAGTVISDADGVSSETITGLAGSTTYQFYVRSVCGPNNKSVPVGPYSVTTGFYDTGGPDGLYGANENVTWVIPPVNPQTYARVTFSYFQTIGYQDVLYVHNGPDASYPLFKSGQSSTSSGFPAWGYSGYNYPLGPFTSTDISGSLTFVFRSDGAQFYPGWDADVSYVCKNPDYLDASNVVSTTATLSWQETGKANMWDVEIGPAGFVPSGFPTVEDVSNPYDAISLNENTDYEYYVRADCGDGYESGWVGPYAFSTQKSCLKPINLTINHTTRISAEMSWTEVSTAEKWDVEVVPAGTAPTGNPTATEVNKPYTVSGLQANTEYEFYVRSNCGGGETSLWSGPHSFTTDFTIPPGNTFYVNKNVNGGNGNGDSWENASPELADVLNFAREYQDSVGWDATNPLRVFVAIGEYTPLYTAADGQFMVNGSRNNAFVLAKNVHIYGGFDPANGIEDLSDDRVLPIHGEPGSGTILSGDLNSDDGVNFTNYDENAYHVVISSGNVGNASLDGISISGGNANESGNMLVNGQYVLSTSGGGMYVGNSSPSLRNIALSGNMAIKGGGIYLNASLTASKLMNLTVNNNSALENGGGIYNMISSPAFINLCLFGNTSTLGDGGGIYNYFSSPTFTNVTISANTADGDGGGMFNYYSSPVLSNCIIRGNNALNGKEIYTDAQSSASLDYCIYSNNSYDIMGAGSVSVSHSLTANPMFKNAANGNYELQYISPAVNAGSNAAYTSAGGDLQNDMDLNGSSRVNQLASGGIIDIGAYENGLSSSSNHILYVNSAVNGGNEQGNSWANAVPELAEALAWVRLQSDTIPNWLTDDSLQIYVAVGSYKPHFSAMDGQFMVDGGRNNAFVLVKNVQIYGGFDPANGIEDLSDDRVLPIHGEPGSGTILSGDLNSDDGVNFTNYDENAYHVVISSGNVGNASLDGISISGGNANESGNMLVNGQYVLSTSGGGMYVGNSSPSLRNIALSGNMAIKGGGIYLNSSLTASKLMNLTVNNNSALENGGGIYNMISSPAFINLCLFGNTTTLGDGGGIYNYFSSSTFTNVTISANTADGDGGGMFNYYSSPVLSNCIIRGNNALNGKEIYTDAQSSASLDYCIYSNNSYDIMGSGSVSVSHSLTANPMFKNAANGNYELQYISPAVNAGSNAAYTSAGGDLQNDMDLDGSSRVNQLASGGIIDIGAYENHDLLPSADHILYVNSAVNGGNEQGDSWANAVPELAQVLKWGRSQSDDVPNWLADDSLQIYVAVGTYKPLFSATDGQFMADGGRNNAFVLVKNVQIYGGFDPANGIENLSDDRNFNPASGTILSGDIDNVEGNDHNSYHVVIAAGDLGSALLNGLTVRDGNADSSGQPPVYGEAINSSFGGGVYNIGASVRYNHTQIIGNRASKRGGGIYIEGSASLITNTLIASNSSEIYGGGIFINTSSADVVNVTIVDNISTFYGGGIFNISSTPSLKNTVLWGNTAISGDEIFNGSASTTSLDYCLYANASGDIEGPGFIDQSNSLHLDPLFSEINNSDYTLQGNSPAINSGSNAAYTSAGGNLVDDVDLAQNPRLSRDTIDIGAYEYQHESLTIVCQTPSITSFQCIAEVPVGNVDAVVINDTSGEIQPVWSDVLSPNTGCNGDPITLTRTYSVENDLGEAASCSVIFTVADTIAPTASTPPVLTVNADGLIPDPDVSIIEDEVDNCGIPTVAYMGEVSDGLCPETKTRTYRVSDDCGNYTDIFHTLIIDYSSESQFSAAACDSYTWNGQQYTASGDFVQVFTNLAGCDSTVTLHLALNHSTTSEISVTTCDSYTAPDGETYTESGEYTAIVQNSAGCDSTIVIELEISGYTDDCGVCIEGGQSNPLWNSTCTDCAGVVNGTSGPGTPCDDGDPLTENDQYNSNCDCAGTPIFDCVDLGLNIGDACDDGNPNTEGDTVTEDCQCMGTQISPQAASLDVNINWNGDCGNRNTVIKLYMPGTASLIAQYDVMLDMNGDLTVDSIQVGTFDVFVKVDGYLQKGFANVLISNGANTLVVGEITAGDFNNDNILNFTDVSVLSTALGTLIGDPNYSPFADVNCDGIINFTDLSILNSTFGQMGDEALSN